MGFRGGNAMTESFIPVQGTGENLHTNEITLPDGTMAHDEYVRIATVASEIGVNSTTTLLASGATFTGTWERVLGGVSISCRSVGVGGTLYFDFSNDETNVDTFPTAGFTVADNVHEYHNAKVNGRFYRARFVSDAGTQTEFRLYSYFGPYDIGNAPINQTVGMDADAQITRTVLMGETHGGSIKNVFVSGQGHLEVALPLTAFGEIQAVPLTPIFQSVFEYTVDNTELNTNVVTNGGTVTQANAMAVVGTSTTTASTACLRSKRHARYRAGQGGLSRFTTIFDTPVAGTEQLEGLADETGSTAAFKNGYMIGYLGTVFGFHRFQNDAVTTIAIANWDDPLDGTGISGVTIDLTKGNVWQIKFQYLGFGAQFISVEDRVTGALVQVHTAPYANTNTSPSVHNPNFHHSIWANNGATTSDIVVKSASYAYFIEGLTKFQEIHQPHQTTGEKQKTTVTTEVAIVTIRNKTLYASKTNFIDILIENIGASIEAANANNLGKVRLVRNATLGGAPSFTDINTANSLVDFDVAGTTVTGGKELITIALAGKNDRENLDVSPYEFILGPGETITLAGSSAGSATIDTSILWKELF